MTNSNSYSYKVLQEAVASGLRTGQYLFNQLPGQAANVIAGQLWDPFHHDYSPYELRTWIENHLILDGNEVVGVFNKDKILWEREDGDGDIYANVGNVPPSGSPGMAREAD